MPNDTHAALDALGREFSRYLSMKNRERLKGYKKRPAAPEKQAEKPTGPCEKCSTGDCEIPEHLEDAVASLTDRDGADDPGDHDYSE